MLRLFKPIANNLLYFSHNAFVGCPGIASPEVQIDFLVWREPEGLPVLCPVPATLLKDRAPDLGVMLRQTGWRSISFDSLVSTNGRNVAIYRMEFLIKFLQRFKHFISFGTESCPLACDVSVNVDIIHQLRLIKAGVWWSSRQEVRQGAALGSLGF